MKISYFNIYLNEIKHNLYIYCFLFILIFVINYFYYDQILYMLIKPVIKFKKIEYFILTTLTEAFITKLHISCFISLTIWLIIISIHIWFFIAPGLYKYENTKILQLFFILIIYNYIVLIIIFNTIIPYFSEFFLCFYEKNNTSTVLFQTFLEPKLTEYISFILNIFLYTTLFFQIPIVFTICLQINLLIKYRKILYIIVLLVATIITPPDVITQILLSLPIYCLIEFSIFLRILIINLLAR